MPDHTPLTPEELALLPFCYAFNVAAQQNAAQQSVTIQNQPEHLPSPIATSLPVQKPQNDFPLGISSTILSPDGKERITRITIDVPLNKTP